MNRLKEFREKAGKRQNEIAAIINVSLPNYCKKENGDIRVSLLEAKVLSEYFNASIDDIFFDNKASKKET